MTPTYNARHAPPQSHSLPARPAAVVPDDRVAVIDVIRGLALFGVLLVNLMSEFRVSIFQQFLQAPAATGGIDGAIEYLVSFFVEMKAFALFSLLFGVGLAIQFDRLAPRGAPFYWLGRRLLALLGFGLIHLLLIWNGDILTEYAIAALLALPLLRLRQRYLAIAAAVLLFMYAVPSALPWTISWYDMAMLRQHVEQANLVYATGSLRDIVQYSQSELPLYWPLHLYVFPRTLALLATGMLLWRSGLLNGRKDYRAAIRATAVAGILCGSAILAAQDMNWISEATPAGKACENLAPVLMALGYAAAILWLTEIPRIAAWLRAVFAPMGRMAFTNYLSQSLICGCIFFGYGWGQFGHMRASVALAVVLAIYVTQIIWSIFWLRHYRFGPVEWLWRTLMYGSAQPMRLRARTWHARMDGSNSAG